MDFLAGLELLGVADGVEAVDEPPLPPPDHPPPEAPRPLHQDDIVQGFHGAGHRRPSGRNRVQQAAHARAAIKAVAKRRRRHKLDRLSDAWDDAMCLRMGDLVDRGGKPGLHNNRWSIPGLLRLGYRGVGRNAVASSGQAIGESTHALDALVTGAWIATKAQEQAFRLKLWSALEYPGAALGLVINWHHDATPWLCRFGAMQEQVYRHARYLVKRDDGMWRAIPYSQFVGQTGKSSPSSGTLEMLGQSIDVHWSNPNPNELRTSTDLELLIPPRAIESTRSSCLYRACDEACESLSVEELCKISARTKLFILGEVPDNVAANNRKKAAFAEKLPRNCLYSARNGCCVHRVHRIVVASTREDTLVGDVHAVAFVCQMPRLRAKNLESLRDVVSSSLQILTPEEADPAWERHSHAVLQHTLGRNFHFVSNHDNHIDSDDPPASSQVTDRINWVRQFLNGDIRSERIQHVERGCCNSREETIDNIVSAISSSGLISGLDSELPSKNRWGSCARHLAEQVAGHMFHNVLNRTLAKANPRWEVIEAAAAQDDDDYRKMMRGKVIRSVLSTNTSQKRLDLALLSWISVPLDHLWMKLQYMDFHGSALFDIVFWRTSPFAEAQQSFGVTLATRIEEGRLKPLFHQYVSCDVGKDQLTTRIREMTMAMSAQVWWWFELVFSSWPYMLLRMVDQRHLATPLAVAKEFWDDHFCNKDSWFSEKLMTLFRSAEEMASDPTLLVALNNWGRTAKVSNMHLERMLARMKKGTPQKAPMLERLLAAGTLGEWIRRHTKSWNGSDPRVVTRERLLQDGAPLRSARKRRAQSSTLGGLPAALIFANERAAEAKRAGVAEGHAPHVRSMRAYVAAYQGLSAEEKQPYIDAARNRRTTKKQRVKERAEQRASAAAIKPDFEQHGLGLSSESWPIRPEVAREVAVRELGLPEAALPGASQLWQRARPSFRTSSFVRDAG